MVIKENILGNRSSIQMVCRGGLDGKEPDEKKSSPAPPRHFLHAPSTSSTQISDEDVIYKAEAYFCGVTGSKKNSKLYTQEMNEMVKLYTQKMNEMVEIAGDVMNKKARLRLLYSGDTEVLTT